jgi:hypothetical protein
MTPDADKADRVERFYYPDGTLREEIHYRGVSEHGRWRQWHPNGQLAGEWWLDKGVYMNGTNRTWYPDGALESEDTYANGNEIKALHYSPSGKLLPTLSDQQRRRLRKLVAKAKLAKPGRGRRVDPDEAARTQAFVQERLAGPTAGAREWLRGASDASRRNLGEMDTDVSIELVEHLHDLGSGNVLAVDITDITGCDDQTTNHVLVQLPDDPESRARVFSLCNALTKEQGFDAEPDHGQEFLYLLLC